MCIYLSRLGCILHIENCPCERRYDDVQKMWGEGGTGDEQGTEQEN